MKKQDELTLGIPGSREETEKFHSLQNQPLLRPIHALNRGAAILEEISNLVYEGFDSVDRDQSDRELEKFLGHMIESFGADLIEFVSVKFGIVTSAVDPNPFRVMTSTSVAQRLIDRHRINPEEFRAAFIQVIEEEIHSDKTSQFFDLHQFEENTFLEIEELAQLSENPALKELLHFANDLDSIFQRKSYLFGYLEHRYSDFFKITRMTPQYLAVQIALDYLSYREHYQLGIINDYEKLMSACGPDPMVAHSGSPLLQ